MAAAKSILITGATGQQGGAIAAALAGQGYDLRAMTRKPDSPAARALAGRGATIVKGDLDDDESIRRALEGVWGAFSVQNTWEAGAWAAERARKV